MKRVILVSLLLSAALTATFSQQTTAFAAKPAAVTAAGQSADFEMIKVLLTRGKIPYSADSVMKAESMDASAKTLILVVGASSKGLGAAGISSDDEIARVKALLKRAKSLDMSVITVHVGGGSRRGPLSDGLIELCMAESDYAVIVADGDTDGFFTKLAADKGIALTKVARISASGAPLVAAFK